VPDVVDRATRSRMMSGIRGTNTRPELFIRSQLHRRGYRYVLHDKRLPGKPDLVFPSRRAVIFVHGCFWHCHDCHLFKWPSSRMAFWKNKITRNKTNDLKHADALLSQGWRVLTIWECALKGRTRRPPEVIIEAAERWLQSDRVRGVILGRHDGHR
jgi:DNA mismatch endonuclease, patch repair protein